MYFTIKSLSVLLCTYVLEQQKSVLRLLRQKCETGLQVSLRVTSCDRHAALKLPRVGPGNKVVISGSAFQRALYIMTYLVRSEHRLELNVTEVNKMLKRHILTLKS